MAGLVSLLLVCSLCLLLTGYSLKMMHSPFGPKMCEELSQQSTESFVYMRENLSCRQIPPDCFNQEEYLTCLKTMKTKHRIYLATLPRNKSCEINHSERQEQLSLSEEYRFNINLHTACQKGMICTVKYILSLGFEDINCRDEMGRTPVMAAVLHRQVEVFDFLVSKGCDLLLKDDKRRNVLHIASLCGNTDIVRKLIVNQNYNINSTGSEGWTPVMYAAFIGQTKVVSMLVNKGCNLTIVSDDGNNVLHWACQGGHAEVVRYIISLNKVGVESRGNRGRTPLLCSAVTGHIAVFDVLINKGCNLKATDDRNNTVIHLACIGGHVAMVEAILSRNMSLLEARGFREETPLLTAASAGHIKVVDVLRGKGCDMETVNMYRNNILHQASLHGYKEMVQYILDKNIVDLDSRGFQGGTPVLLAALKGKVKVVDLLIRRDCDVKAVDYNGDSMLHLACRGGHLSMVQYIISNNIVGIDSTGYNGRTPVMEAAKKGHEEAVRYLIRNSCNIKLLDNDENNILHIACQSGQLGVVKYIFGLGILLEREINNNNRTPLQVAYVHGHEKVVSFLEANK